MADRPLPADHAAAVQVTASIPAPNAEDVAQAVAAPIEQQLSSLDGLLYTTSATHPTAR